MPKLPDKKKPQTAKPNVPKAVKAVALVEIPEATLLGTAHAIILAGLGESHGQAIAHVAGDPAKLRGAGLPDKLPHWVVSLAMRLDRDARDAWNWRHQGMPLGEERPERSWGQIRLAEEGKPEPPPAQAPVEFKPKPAAPSSKKPSLFDL